MASMPLVLNDLCQFDKEPSKIAIEYYYYANKDKTSGKISESFVTYGELKQQARAVASNITNVIGNLKTSVGILMGPCIEYPAIVLGVLLTKNTFVPLEIESSDDQLIWSVLSLGIEYIVGHTHYSDYVKKVFKKFVVNVYPVKMHEYKKKHFQLSLYNISSTKEGKRRDLMPCATNTAYVVHTSGTTGSPKIIAVPHECIIPNILHLRAIFHIGEKSKVAAMAPTTFDPSIVELFMALSMNATLVIPSSAIKRNPSDLAKTLFTEAKVTVLQATPSLIRRFSLQDLHEKIFNSESSLQTMIFGGEKCPTCKTIRSWIKTKSVQAPLSQSFFNLYGITEVSSWASCYEIPEIDILHGLDEEVPLGSPLYLTSLEVRKEDMVICTSSCIINDPKELQSININASSTFTLNNSATEDFVLKKDESLEITGNLFVGSKERVCCIDGKQSENFVDSGDLVKVKIIDDKIQFFFIERSDSIIKRLGKKVNLDRIAAVLESNVEVQHCHLLSINSDELVAFVVRKDENMSATVDTYFITTFNAKKWTLKLLNVLSQALDATQLPSHILQINTIPITHHGKINETVIKELFKEHKRKKLTMSYTLQGLLEVLDIILPTCTRGHYSCEVLQNYGWKEFTFPEMGGDSFQATMFINWIEIFLEMPFLEVFPNAIDILFRCKLLQFAEELHQKILKFDKLKTRGSCKKHKLDTMTELVISSKLPNLIQEKLSAGNIQSIRRGNSGQNLNSDHKNITDVFTTATNIKAELTIEWKYDTRKCIDASPLLLSNKKSGTCFIGSHSHGFYAILMRNGNKIWEKTLPDRIESSACLSPCNNYVVVGCYDSCVYVLNVTNGKEHWKFTTGSQVKCSPCPGKPGSSVVFIGSHDGCFYCLDVKNQKCTWKIDLKAGSIFSSPRLHVSEGEEVVYVATLGGRLVSLSCVEGKVLWQNNINKPLFSSPCVCSVGVCIGSVDHSLYMFNHLTGEKIWSFKTSGPIFSSPGLGSDGTTVLVGSHDHCLYNVFLEDGSLIWKNTFSSPVYSTPFSFVWNVNREKFCLVICASTNGEICVVDQLTGAVVLTMKLPGETFSSPIAVMKDGNCFKILIGCRDNNLYCLNCSIKTN